jgi:hypothetical protein
MRIRYAENLECIAKIRKAIFVGKFGKKVLFGDLSIDGGITLENIVRVYEEVTRTKTS